jgi:excisionase family DNA binding protein
MPAQRRPKPDAAVPPAAAFITLEAAAAHLGISRRVLDGMIKRGELRPTRLGKRIVRVSVAELERLARGA